MILDAGVLIAFDRGDARAHQLIDACQQRGVDLRTTQPVVAQVWRDEARQARLASLLRHMTIHPLLDGRAVGSLLAGSGTADVVDAHLVQLGSDLGEPVLTGDPGDLRPLAAILDDRAPAIFAWP